MGTLAPAMISQSHKKNSMGGVKGWEGRQGRKGGGGGLEVKEKPHNLGDTPCYSPTWTMSLDPSILTSVSGTSQGGCCLGVRWLFKRHTDSILGARLGYGRAGRLKVGVSRLDTQRQGAIRRRWPCTTAQTVTGDDG